MLPSRRATPRRFDPRSNFVLRPRSGWPQAHRSCTVAADHLQQAEFVLPGDMELVGNQLPVLAFQYRKGSSAMTQQQTPSSAATTYLSSESAQLQGSAKCIDHPQHELQPRRGLAGLELHQETHPHACSQGQLRLRQMQGLSGLA